METTQTDESPYYLITESAEAAPESILQTSFDFIGSGYSTGEDDTFGPESTSLTITGSRSAVFTDADGDQLDFTYSYVKVNPREGRMVADAVGYSATVYLFYNSSSTGYYFRVLKFLYENDIEYSWGNFDRY